MKHLSCLLLILPWMAACSPSTTNPNRILAENELPGTTEWLIDVPYDTCSLPDHRFCRRPQVEGYCSQTSYQAGDTVDLFVSTEPGAQYTIDIYRMGYYQGKGGHLKKSTGPLPGKSQPMPEPDPQTNFAECKWEAGYRLPITGEWTSGVYLCKLTTLPARHQSYIIFIIK